MLFVCPWFICGCDDFAIEQAVLGGDGMELIMVFLTLLAGLYLAHSAFVTLLIIDIYRKTKKSQKPVPPVSAILTMLVN